MVAAVLCVTFFGLYLGAAVVARHRAQSVADLASLAAAAELPRGVAAACARATAVAREMGVGGIECRADGLDVVVSVEVAANSPAVARAVARAGPTGVHR